MRKKIFQSILTETHTRKETEPAGHSEECSKGKLPTCALVGVFNRFSVNHLTSVTKRRPHYQSTTTNRVSPAVTVSPRQTSNTFFFPYKYPVLNASRSQFAVFQFKQPLLHFHSKPKSHTEKNHKILALHVYLNQSLF